MSGCRLKQKTKGVKQVKFGRSLDLGGSWKGKRRERDRTMDQALVDETTIKERRFLKLEQKFGIKNNLMDDWVPFSRQCFK